MKTKRISVLSLALALPLFLMMACDSGSTPGSEGPPSLNSMIDSVSYGLGYAYGEQFRNQGMTDLELQTFLAGMNNALNEVESAIADSTMQRIFTNYQMQAQQRAQQQSQQTGQQNQQEGEQYRTENAQNEGVVETDSGLQYEVLQEGSGASPSAGDSVVVAYEGSLIDGTVFDSSEQHGGPQGFVLEGLIQGWQEGIALMQEGARYQFVIPPDLAYGARGAGQQIGPNETLIFEVELVEVHELDQQE